MNLELWFAHVLYSSIIASLMVILLLTMKKLFPNRFSARFVHMLWILILIRLLMPLDIENPLKISSLLPDQVKPIPYQEVVALATGDNNILKSSQNGTTTYYKLIPEAGTKAPGDEANHQNTESTLAGQRFAQIMQAQLVQQLGTADLGTQAMRIIMLNEVTMPAVAPQIAFISNKSDREKLNTEAFRIKAAQALHDGIIEALLHRDVLSVTKNT